MTGRRPGNGLFALTILLLTAVLLRVAYSVLFDRLYTVVSMSVLANVLISAAGLAGAAVASVESFRGAHPVLESDDAWRLRRDRPAVAALLLVLSVAGFAVAAAFTARLAIGAWAERLSGTESARVAWVKDVWRPATGGSLCKQYVTVTLRESSDSLRFCVTKDMTQAQVRVQLGETVNVYFRETALATLVVGAAAVEDMGR